MAGAGVKMIEGAVFINIEKDRIEKEKSQSEYCLTIGIANRQTYINRIKHGGWTPNELKMLRLIGDLNQLLEHVDDEIIDDSNVLLRCFNCERQHLKRELTFVEEVGNKDALFCSECIQYI